MACNTGTPQTPYYRFMNSKQELLIAGVPVKGAQQLISYDPTSDKDSQFRHFSEAGGKTIPRIEMFEHGLRLGGTFITAEALRQLIANWNNFMERKSLVVQP